MTTPDQPPIPGVDQERFRAFLPWRHYHPCNKARCADYTVCGVPDLMFTVVGNPIGQGQVSFMGKGRPAIHSNRKTLYPWRDRVRDAAVVAIMSAPGGWEPLVGAVAVDRYYTMPRPASREGRARAHPTVNSALNSDIDHLDRAVFDALKGTVYADDALVCGGTHWKTYPGGHPDCPLEPGVTVRVYRLGDHHAEVE